MSPIRPRRNMGIVLLVLLPFALVATAAWALSGHTSASPESSARPETAPWARLPLYGLLRAPTDSARRAHRAEQRLVVTCMAAQGFRYTPAFAAVDSGTSPALFGVESLDPSGGATGAPEPQPSEQRRGEGFDRALYGDPDLSISARNKVLRVTRPATGCLAEAQTRLQGEAGRKQDLTLRMQLDQGERDALQALEKDPAFRTLTTRWRACMRRAGVTADDPRELIGDLPRGTDPATSPAIRTDVKCKESTGYLKAAYGRLAAMQQQWVDANRKPVAEWKALRLYEDGVAREILKTDAS